MEPIRITPGMIFTAAVVVIIVSIMGLTSNFGNQDMDEFIEYKQQHNNFPGEELLGVVVKRYADVNTVDNLEKSALHYAAEHGFVDICKVLINRGANINAQSSGGWTPLHYAAALNRTEVIKLLINKGAKLDVLDNLFSTPLAVAVVCLNEPSACLLAQAGANPNIKDVFKKTAKDWAIKTSYHSYDALLESGKKKYREMG